MPHFNIKLSLKLNVDSSKYSISYLSSKSVLKFELNVDLNTLWLQKCQTRKHSSLLVSNSCYLFFVNAVTVNSKCHTFISSKTKEKKITQAATAIKIYHYMLVVSLTATDLPCCWALFTWVRKVWVRSSSRNSNSSSGALSPFTRILTGAWVQNRKYVYLHTLDNFELVNTVKTQTEYKTQQCNKTLAQFSFFSGSPGNSWPALAAK